MYSWVCNISSMVNMVEWVVVSIPASRGVDASALIIVFLALIIQMTLLF